MGGLYEKSYSSSGSILLSRTILANLFLYPTKVSVFAPDVSTEAASSQVISDLSLVLQVTAR